MGIFFTSLLSGTPRPGYALLLSCIIGRETLLDIMNLLLAVATIAFFVVIVVAGWRGVLEYRKNRSLANTELSRMLKRLGITLPDGGKKIDEEEEQRKGEIK
jgi:hypothetical protein